jgi:hypothetical protein
MINRKLRLDSVSVKWDLDEEGDGNWYCVATAEVSYALSKGNRRLEHLDSGGLYGIEDPDSEYQRLVTRDELADLRAHLEAFGVDTARFDELAKPAYDAVLFDIGVRSVL